MPELSARRDFLYLHRPHYLKLWSRLKMNIHYPIKKRISIIGPLYIKVYHVLLVCSFLLLHKYFMMQRRIIFLHKDKQLCMF